MRICNIPLHAEWLAVVYSVRRRRTIVDTAPMKGVKTSVGTTYLYPRQLYCYSSIISALREKVCLPEFIEKCERWQNRMTCADVYEDVFDGRLWKQFLTPNNIPFLSLPYNFALCLNVDWFQPFKHSHYSCGAIYVAILNLPRSERYSSENVILLGVIPGPKEPELTKNSFLEPLVDELLQLWDGVAMKTHNTNDMSELLTRSHKVNSNSAGVFGTVSSVCTAFTTSGSSTSSPHHATIMYFQSWVSILSS